MFWRTPTLPFYSLQGRRIPGKVLNRGSIRWGCSPRSRRHRNDPSQGLKDHVYTQLAATKWHVFSHFKLTTYPKWLQGRGNGAWTPLTCGARVHTSRFQSPLFLYQVFSVSVHLVSRNNINKHCAEQTWASRRHSVAIPINWHLNTCQSVCMFTFVGL